MVLEADLTLTVWTGLDGFTRFGPTPKPRTRPGVWFTAVQVWTEVQNRTMASLSAGAMWVVSLTWLRASVVQDSHILPVQCAPCRLIACPINGGDV